MPGGFPGGMPALPPGLDPSALDPNAGFKAPKLDFNKLNKPKDEKGNG
jgi:signal recognition particle subunit SRP54